MSNRFWLSPVTCVVLTLVAVPVSAGAQPPSGGVPDMSGFADVTGDFTTHFGRPGTVGVDFVTADGVGCSFGIADPAYGQPGPSPGVSCSGSLPGIATIPLDLGSPLQGACDWGHAQAESGTPGHVSHYKNPAYDKFGCSAAGDTKVLGVGQKVTNGVVTCGVADGDVTVCVTGSHGFVLKPSGSFGF